ncbi:hypothetical protein GH975_03975 [Litorivicinus lipolyticus]|uniref:Uncharacterized protein n=1 Tax=Litorivicinus lipolyticus TaxID=418701 RepID=A0A5Q2QBX2_9GAMM|nr:hypothetical protein [Litorivicinus lipolyticus]QGG79772.1 hypothetical protein GH975_03975 [Litorivicinus lipolyticus]
MADRSHEPSNLTQPGPYAAENLNAGEAGRFFDDYCNWQRIQKLEQFMQHSFISEAAATLMRSRRAQLFHNHVLVK